MTDEGIMLLLNEDGTADVYDDTWDITIHCTSEEEQKEAIKLLKNQMNSKWIPCSERLPENETEVEISCIRRVCVNAQGEKKEYHFTARAFYTDGTMTTEDSGYTWDDCDNWEYDEEKDAYIIPEGWWEYVTFSEEFGVVDAEVVAWMPLHDPYKPETEGNDAE